LRDDAYARLIALTRRGDIDAAHQLQDEAKRRDDRMAEACAFVVATARPDPRDWAHLFEHLASIRDPLPPNWSRWLGPYLDAHWPVHVRTIPFGWTDEILRRWGHLVRSATTVLERLEEHMAWLPNITHLDLSTRPAQGSNRWIDPSSIRDLAPFVKLVPRLTYLNLDQTHVGDLTPLVGLNGLRTLKLRSTDIRDLTPLRRLPHLEHLDVADTRIDDIAPLANLRHLQSLDLDDTRVAEIGPLMTCRQLEVLSLSNNRALRSIRPISALTRLWSLAIAHTRVEDFSSLGSLVNLRELNLDHSRIRDLSPLTHCNQLRMLDLSSTPVQDLRPLEGLQHLEVLDLEHVPATNMRPLQHLSRLRELSLRRCAAIDLSPLVHLTALRWLNLEYADIDEADIHMLSPLREQGLQVQR